jgi:hypothetical protein
LRYLQEIGDPSNASPQVVKNLVRLLFSAIVDLPAEATSDIPTAGAAGMTR